MRMDKLTTKFQQALADAQSLAVGRDNQYIEPVHLMAALLDQQGGTARPLLEKAGVPPPYVLVGHSLGGSFMSLAADAAPPRSPLTSGSSCSGFAKPIGGAMRLQATHRIRIFPSCRRSMT